MRRETSRRVRAVLRYSPAFGILYTAGCHVLRRTFCVALGVFLLNTGIWGQQLKAREDQAKPATAWRKLDATKVSLPAGTMLAVPLIDPVSSDRSQAGNRFHGSLDAPVVISGTVVADQGGAVVGRIVRARKAGRMTTPSELVLELVELVLPTDRVRIETDPIERIPDSSSMPVIWHPGRPKIPSDLIKHHSKECFINQRRGGLPPLMI